MFVYRSSNDFQKWYDHILDHHIWNPGTFFNVRFQKNAYFYSLILVE